MAKYGLNSCNCDSCRDGEAQIVRITENGVIIFSVDIRGDGARQPGIMRIGFNEKWVYEGPIIRTEEDLFNAFAAMTQKRLKGGEDG